MSAASPLADVAPDRHRQITAELVPVRYRQDF